jgi:hypothetical protein
MKTLKALMCYSILTSKTNKKQKTPRSFIAYSIEKSRKTCNALIFYTIFNDIDNCGQAGDSVGLLRKP